MNFRTLILAFSILSIAFFSCKSTPENPELENYVFKVMPIYMKEELDIVKQFKQISTDDLLSNATGDSTVQNVIIPNYKNFIAKLDTVTVKDPELKKVHEKYLESAKLQLDYFEYFLLNIRRKFNNSVDSLNMKTDEQRALNKEWAKMLNELCNKYGVEYLQR